MAILDLKRCTMKIKDGSGTPKVITVRIGEGNMQWTERRNIEYIKDRGIIDEVREGDQEPVDVSFEFTWTEIKSITGDTTPTPYEAIKKTDAASSWVSSDSDTCRPYAVDIEITNDPLCTGSGSATSMEVVLLSDFRYEEISADYRNSSISVTGKCNITAPTVTRAANT